MQIMGKHVENNEKHIDPHVHCRDGKEKDKATIGEVAQLAINAGICAMFDMPNTNPPIINADLVEERLIMALHELDSLNGYYLYIGITANPEQVKDAARIVNTYPKVVGAKMFAGKSVGDLAIINDDCQRTVYRTLAEVGYTGVLAVHCEYEGLFRPELWIPERPSTWNLARPPMMEIRSVENQIKFAWEEGFKGHLHICHASVPRTVELVDEARAYMQISCGVTPHHLLHSTEDMQTIKGMKYKVNPPLRSKKTMLEMRELLRQGKIDWIESDHAPHEKERKTYNEDNPKDFYMSGIRSLEEYKRLLREMKRWGITDEQIHELTYLNIKKVFVKVAE